MPMLKNVVVDWAEVIQENKKYGGWSVEVRVTPELAEQLKSLGIYDKVSTTKKDYAASKEAGTDIFKEVDPYIKFRRYKAQRSGKINEPPTAVDIANLPLTDLVGNGSVCNVLINLYDKKDGSGKGMVFQGIQVLELVPYGGADEGFENLASDSDVPFDTDEDDEFESFAAGN